MLYSKEFNGPCVVEYEFTSQDIVVNVFPEDYAVSNFKHSCWLRVSARGSFQFQGNNLMDLALMKISHTPTTPVKFKVGDFVKVIKTGEFGTITRVMMNVPPIFLVSVGQKSPWLFEKEIEHVGTINSGVAIRYSAQAPAAAADSVENRWIGDFDDTADSENDLKEKRKKEGRCEECGDLLPMSIHGLLDCPKHPKPFKGKQ